VTASWNIGGLLSGLTLRDPHPAVIAFCVEASQIGVCPDRSAVAADPLREIPALSAAGTPCPALAGGARRAAQTLTPEDTALLRDPTTEAVRALLRERYPEEMLDFDVDRALDLNVAFFG
jgi:hypothetical protein